MPFGIDNGPGSKRKHKTKASGCQGKKREKEKQKRSNNDTGACTKGAASERARSDRHILRSS